MITAIPMTIELQFGIIKLINAIRIHDSNKIQLIK